MLSEQCFRVLDDDDSGTLIAVLGVVLGAIFVLIFVGVAVLLIIKLHSKRRASKGREYGNDENKSDSHILKECKEPCVSSNQGPDIIPEKSYFQERSDSLPQVIEVEQGVNPSLSTSDPSSRKYRELQSVSYPDDPTLMAAKEPVIAASLRAPNDINESFKGSHVSSNENVFDFPFALALGVINFSGKEVFAEKHNIKRMRLSSNYALLTSAGVD
ncbi:uncharacterized protein CDAR_16921 [Caerostris darwini]|uniref:Uncharacterized protein n=1 Tax=Caerostris darwini TaxID=1538125 RepID=A0AAV4PNM3_9ARAC|nr:uncharacterized protein CDAR_16921 [Caerostris darwini]